MTTFRDRTRQVYVGSVAVGGGAEIPVQSMTNTSPTDVDATLDQIRRLKVAGADIVRVAVPDMDAATALAEIVKGAGLPIVADVHFDYRLALAAMEAGCAGLRINPGNIGGPEKVDLVAREARDRAVAVRVGVNAGSLEKELLGSGSATASAMVDSATRHVEMLEKRGVTSIKVSLKASDRQRTLDANRKWAQTSDIPLHLGLTEAGTAVTGAVRSAAVLGELLADGIGDTIRISLSADPALEVKAGLELLRVLGLRKGGVRIVACPTCGRCAQRFDVVGIAAELEQRLSFVRTPEPITVAVMGCAVNGPGEAREADIGVAGGKSTALLFKKGEKVGVMHEGEVLDRLVQEVELMLAESKSNGK